MIESVKVIENRLKVRNTKTGLIGSIVNFNHTFPYTLDRDEKEHVDILWENNRMSLFVTFPLVDIEFVE